MVEIELKHVQDLRDVVTDSSRSMDERSLAVRRFCNDYKANAPQPPRASDDHTRWTKVDTEHLLEISTTPAALSNYLVERVAAASDG